MVCATQQVVLQDHADQPVLLNGNPILIEDPICQFGLYFYLSVLYKTKICKLKYEFCPTRNKIYLQYDTVKHFPGTYSSTCI